MQGFHFQGFSGLIDVLPGSLVASTSTVDMVHSTSPLPVGFRFICMFFKIERVMDRPVLCQRKKHFCVVRNCRPRPGPFKWILGQRAYEVLPSRKIQGLMGEGMAPSGLDGPMNLQRRHCCHCSGQCSNIHCTDPVYIQLGAHRLHLNSIISSRDGHES